MWTWEIASRFTAGHRWLVDIRKKLIEENRLDGVVFMPSGILRPYAGVSTAVLLFTARRRKFGSTTWSTTRVFIGRQAPKGGRERHARRAGLLEHRRDAKFQQKRTQRLADLQKQIASLKKDRLEHHAIIHCLKFDEVVSKTTDTAQAAREKAETELAELQSRITPLQAEINQLTRQFWTTKDQVRTNKYDLSASRYRQVEQDEEFYEQPRVTLVCLTYPEVRLRRETPATWRAR